MLKVGIGGGGGGGLLETFVNADVAGTNLEKLNGCLKSLFGGIGEVVVDEADDEFADEDGSEFDDEEGAFQPLIVDANRLLFTLVIAHSDAVETTGDIHVSLVTVALSAG